MIYKDFVGFHDLRWFNMIYNEFNMISYDLEGFTMISYDLQWFTMISLDLQGFTTIS